ncbi:MAG: phosphoribosylformylglycinamidine synthase subunit PurS [Acidobacteriota bacterium]
MYQALVTITLRTSILDVQGKAVEHGIHSLGMTNVSNVRIGKHIELTIDAPDEAEASRITDEACRRILANQVMEDYTYTVKKV